MKILILILIFKMLLNDFINYGVCYCYNVLRIVFGRLVFLNNELLDEDDDDFIDDILFVEFSEYL